jgi:hypothetical protein
MLMKYGSEARVSGRQNELILACGKGKNSSISILKKGISINDLTRLTDLPTLSEPNGLFVVGDSVFLKFYGIP